MCYRTEGLCLCVWKDKFEPFTNDIRSMDLTSKSETVNSHVNSCVVIPALSVTGLPQKKGASPIYCQNHTELKYVKMFPV